MADHEGAPEIISTPENNSKPRPKPPSRKGCVPANAWPKGVSGNPKGRTPHSTAFAERVRAKVDPDLVIDLALRVATDDKLSPTERLTALWPLVDRGWVRPPATTLIGHAADDEPTFDHLSLERRRALLAELEGAPSTDEQVSLKPSLSDDESVKLG